ncbi:imelysin family protein [Nonlabens marinus]|uniref:Iron-regulated protein A n=1 Tax=Nonlabens marinus S1-08 TaxID=1454201 RepID=W8VQJ0_9FLAO|nr:imelysin family protein [Nonlabens marinus]BAO55684.1 iron-regulated protein A precursor [Nonlabens marinus S1-08]
MRKIAFLAFIAITLASCSSDNDTDTGNDQANFDRKAMMVNLADNIIIPAMTDLEGKLVQLTAARAAFTGNPNQSNLDAMRASWLEAYKIWQYVEMFNIGKAEEIQYAFQMNIFPTNVSDIEANISNGGYDLGSVNNQDAVGFPAVEYMIYGLATNDSDIIAEYTTAANAAGNIKYLEDLTDQMKSLTTVVLTDWNNAFRANFIESTGNSATSAINMLVNDFIFYYEKGLRANKIGIPAGVFSNNPLPDRVEGLYSEVYSKELAMESLKAVQDFFNGKAYGSTATGLSYSDYVDASTTVSLSTMINDQFGAASTKMETLNNDLSQQVINDNSQMTMTYDELQRAVIFMKVDMLQILNISVDYVDADGD